MEFRNDMPDANELGQLMSDAFAPVAAHFTQVAEQIAEGFRRVSEAFLGEVDFEAIQRCIDEIAVLGGYIQEQRKLDAYVDRIVARKRRKRAQWRKRR